MSADSIIRRMNTEDMAAAVESLMAYKDGDMPRTIMALRRMTRAGQETLLEYLTAMVNIKGRSKYERDY